MSPQGGGAASPEAPARAPLEGGARSRQEDDTRGLLILLLHSKFSSGGTCRSSLKLHDISTREDPVIIHYILLAMVTWTLMIVVLSVVRRWSPECQEAPPPHAEHPRGV